METATKLVAQFDRMVRGDGGHLELLGVDDGVIRVGYRPGVDPTCEDGVCVLPGAELQAMMTETLARRDPSLSVVVEPIA
jgi:hypothetical protein